MFHWVVQMCRANNINQVNDLAKEAGISLRSMQYWLQSEGISWDGVRHNIAFLDLEESGWWDDGYPLHPDEKIKKYYGMYCSDQGVMLRKCSKKALGRRFYKYVEIGSYDRGYTRITLGKGNTPRTSECLQNIVAKCFLGKTEGDIVRFKNGNTYDCHIWNLYLEEKESLFGEDTPREPPLDEWTCSQCKDCITDPKLLYFRHEAIFCSENCADISEEDLKYVKVSLDNDEEEGYNS